MKHYALIAALLLLASPASASNPGPHAEGTYRVICPGGVKHTVEVTRRPVVTAGASPVEWLVTINWHAKGIEYPIALPDGCSWIGPDFETALPGKKEEAK